MSQTRMVSSQHPDADVVMKENAAAAALVDVAASFAKKASDSASSPSTGAATLLPTDIASRKQWDREQAAPPADTGVARRTSNSKETVVTATPAGTGDVTNGASNTGTTTTNPTTAATNYPASSSLSYHQTQSGDHAATAQAPLLHAQPQVQANRRVVQNQPVLGSARPDPAQWPSNSHHASAYPHHPAAHAVHHAAHAHHAHVAATAAAHHAHAAAAAARTQLPFQQPPGSMVLMSMSSIGFGVAPASSTDATEAVIRAVQDSMERSAVRLPTAASLRRSLSIHLKVGVPPRPSGEPMHVDTSRVFLYLPQSVPVLPVEIVVGGLLVDHNEIEEATAKQTGGVAVNTQQPTICTAVACVTLQQSSPEGAEQIQGNTPLNSASPATTTSAPPTAHHTPPTAHHTLPPPPPAPQMSHHRATSSGQMNDNGLAPPMPSKVNRTNSIEVLAHVSGEIRDRQLSAARNDEAAVALAMVSANEATSMDTTDSSLLSRGSFSSANGSKGGSLDGNNAYSYKKLAPGMTPKNNKRLFVRHDYKDYSREEPLPEERFLLRSDTRTPNAAFPLKLHETLTQIEQDGYGHIIGWMPHGRSFKIHQQQEFVDIVLPRYFVMTKKSSFLRQLNLYSFNRISVGPDSGSYYHEKFLRGLKFLCRRMTRQKVNGNGIRAAGNPDEEPTLHQFPVCPPQNKLGSSSCNSSVSQNESDDVDRPYSRLMQSSLLPGSQAMRPSPTSGGEAEAEGGKESDENASQDSRRLRTREPLRVASKDDSSASQASFPLKLQRILDQADENGKRDIISWLPHGRAFLVHDVDRFVAEVMPIYFNQTKYSSFQRQLHMYNFQRITFGRDKGAYHHDKFQRGRPDLCMTMVRTRVNGKGCRRPGDPDNEPDFYVEWEQEGSPGVGNSNEKMRDEEAERRAKEVEMEQAAEESKGIVEV